MAAVNEEQRILQTVWKRAYKEGSVRLVQANARQASRLRMMLYTTAQKAKREPHLDYELADAVSECFITIENDKEVVVMMKSETQLMQGIKEALGLKPADLAAPEEKHSNEEASVLARMHNSPLAGLITRED